VTNVAVNVTALTRRSAVDGIRKERRGFASMSPEKQREIASKGGRAAHEKGTAHEWTADEARAAGRKGGQISRGGRGRLMPTTNAADVSNVGAVPASGMEPGRLD
jgi:general stress protein YciG